MNVKSFNSNVPNLKIFIDENDIVIISKDSLECLSNAVINGGRVKSNAIINHHVSLDFDHTNLEEVLEPIKNKFKLSDSTIGLFTAVEMKKAVLVNEKVDDVDYTLILTAGLTNTSAPIIKDLDLIRKNKKFTKKPGTINIIILINGILTEHATVNLFITITEAKTLLLNLLEIRTNDGRLATGTSTDTIVICFTSKGQLIEWSGYATKFGQSIGYTVFKSLKKALKGSR
ncbi:MAG: adenosylcobinamide amidohydrolase [Candidatus Odinarchaeota archaeon]